MERHEACLALARRELEAAQKTLEITYKLLEEPKVLAVAAGKLQRALMNAMRGMFDEDPKMMLQLFRARQARRYRFSEDFSRVIEEVLEIVEEHRRSPVEFARHGNLVICTENYELTMLTHEMLKERMEKAKIFIREAENLLS
jgi:hypothetical protein